MFVKICTILDEAPDITTIECDQVRFCKDSARKDKKDVRILHIYPTNKKAGSEPIRWLVSGGMQVYLLNDEGKTIDKIW